MNALVRRSCASLNLLSIIANELKAQPLRSLHSCNIVTYSPQIPTLSPIHSHWNYCPVRCKSKKQVDADSDDEGDIFDDDSSLSKDSKIVKFNTTSLRADAILKSALGIARNKIEKIFYESKIRVNGKKILKKSIPVRVDYEIDVIKSVSPKNPNHLYVARIEILNIAAKEETIAVTVRRFKNLLIENYETDPYNPSTSDEDN